MMCTLQFITIVVGTLLCGVQICVGVNHVDTFKDYCAVSDNEVILQNVRSIIWNCGEILAGREQLLERKGLNMRGEPVSKKICRYQGQINGCMNNVAKAVDPCFHGEMMSITTIVVDNIEASLAYSCKDGGERLGTFITTVGECMTEKQEEVMECAVITIGKFQKENCTGGKCTNSADEEAVCRELHALKTCLASTLHKCEDTSADFVEGLIHTFMKSGRCDKYTGVNGSGSIVHLLAQAVISTFVSFVSATLF